MLRLLLTAGVCISLASIFYGKPIVFFLFLITDYQKYFDNLKNIYLFLLGHSLDNVDLLQTWSAIIFKRNVFKITTAVVVRVCMCVCVFEYVCVLCVWVCVREEVRGWEASHRTATISNMQLMLYFTHWLPPAPLSRSTTTIITTSPPHSPAFPQRAAYQYCNMNRDTLSHAP